MNLHLFHVSADIVSNASSQLFKIVRIVAWLVPTQQTTKGPVASGYNLCLLGC